VSQAEAFALRGVIEGFYGPPWSHAVRQDMLHFLALHGFNAFFYAPKDDEYLRERWQEPHPYEQLHQLTELNQLASRLQLAFYYCLSPGLSMQYANQMHLELLLAKYQRMFAAGVRQFGLFFDDIPFELMHEGDRHRFAHLAEAHCYVTERVWQQLRNWSGENRLVVCPTAYFGMPADPYIAYLGANLPAGVEMFWTGRFVCSPFLTEGDALTFVQATGRKPLIWDNYPVNDLAMNNELHIGPLQHRDPRLYRYARGFVANAMELAESSKIPLITIADYLKTPETYEPLKSWERAVREVAGEADAQPFLRFADNVQSSFLQEQESPGLLEAFMRVRFHFFQGDTAQAVVILRELFREMEQTAHYLLERMENQRLAAEVRRWVRKYLQWARVGQAAVALIEEGTRGRMVQAAYHLLRLKQRLKQTERLPEKVCGNVMRLFVEAVLQEAGRRG